MTAITERNMNIVICVFGCATIEKYKLQILKINQTWGKRAKLFPNVKIYFFLGEEPTDLIGEEYVYLKGVKNDYISASHKHNLGLKYAFDNCKNLDFVYVCGTDTYVNIDKLHFFLKKHNPNKTLFICGHGNSKERLNFEQYLHFANGGAGYALSKKSLLYLYPHLENMVDEWVNNTCTPFERLDLVTSCDFCISYYAYIFCFEILMYNPFFSECNYTGHIEITKINGYVSYFHCCPKRGMDEIITCHDMSLSDFDDFTKILEKNDYFMNECSNEKMEKKIKEKNEIYYCINPSNVDVSTKICFITAIYGDFTLKCKAFAKQTISTDFICFTDNENITSNGWTIYTTPCELNQQWSKKYNVIIWLNNRVEIIDEKISEYVMNYIHDEKMMGCHNVHKQGFLLNEVIEKLNLKIH